MNLDEMRLLASQQSLGLSHPDIYNRAVELIREPLLNSKHLLDVGSGQGELLRLLSAQTKSKLTGVDLMPGQGEGIEWFVQDLNSQLQFKNDTFDVVTCIEVVEHIENPRQLIREIFRILKPGGVVVLSTPNNHSWRSIVSYIFRGHFVAFTDSSYPAHITPVNREDIQRIFKEAGFDDISIQFSNKGSLPRFTSITWQTISAGGLKGMRYSDNIFCVATKPHKKV